MERIVREVEQATAGTVTALLITKKPVGARVIIRRVSLTSKRALSFGRCYAHLYNLSKALDARALYNKIVPSPHLEPAVLFDGAVEWPHDFGLWLRVRTQTALEVLYYTIEYEIEEPPKKGWRP